VAAAVSQHLIEDIDCMHLHDWHAAYVAVLRKFHPEHGDLNRIRTVYSIHNLAFQGIRPLRGSESSLEAWFPEMPYDWFSVADPRWPDTANPAAAAIRLSDAVHTVSPTYAAEIQKPSRKPYYFGGEGLEADLQRAAEDGRLTGILNGCPEAPESDRHRYDLDGLLRLGRSRVIRWSGSRATTASAHFVAYARASELGQRATDPAIILTGVGRVGEQKMLILRGAGSDGRSGLEAILEGLGEAGIFVLLGEGDPEYERFLVAMSARFPNFLFLNGYSETCASALYAAGDLFMMPSSFEPCGLSQMLALRNGQPCLVHGVGGLKDTVRNGQNGFVFQGNSLEAQVDAFVQCTLTAIELKTSDPQGWQKIRKNAAATRFSWDDSAVRYIEKLYTR
jgi:starch synthase